MNTITFKADVEVRLNKPDQLVVIVKSPDYHRNIVLYCDEPINMHLLHEYVKDQLKTNFEKEQEKKRLEEEK